MRLNLWCHHLREVRIGGVSGAMSAVDEPSPKRGNHHSQCVVCHGCAVGGTAVSSSEQQGVTRRAAQPVLAGTDIEDAVDGT